jgi:hypothetical protein
LLLDAEAASIPVAKLRDYLLESTHPSNGGKARFFASLGYTKEDWQRLARDLREQHLTQDAIEVEGNAYGSKWTISADLRGPTRSGRILSVWFVDFGQTVPRFVTARPLKETR